MGAAGLLACTCARLIVLMAAVTPAINLDAVTNAQEKP